MFRGMSWEEEERYRANRRGRARVDLPRRRPHWRSESRQQEQNYRATTRLLARLTGGSGGLHRDPDRHTGGASNPREVMVKVLSWGKSKRSARSMLSYIARADLRGADERRDPAAEIAADETRSRLASTKRRPAHVPALFDESGARVPYAEAVRRLNGEFSQGGFGLLRDDRNLSRAARDADAKTRGTMAEADRLRYRQVAHVMLSIGTGQTRPGPRGMIEDTNAERLALEAAAAQTIAETFGTDGHPVLWCVHDDHSGIAHIHALVGVRTPTGRRLSLNRKELHALRVELADQAAALGQPTVASKRIERYAFKAQDEYARWQLSTGYTLSARPVREDENAALARLAKALDIDPSRIDPHSRPSSPPTPSPGQPKPPTLQPTTPQPPTPSRPATEDDEPVRYRYGLHLAIDDPPDPWVRDGSVVNRVPLAIGRKRPGQSDAGEALKALNARGLRPVEDGAWERRPPKRYQARPRRRRTLLHMRAQEEHNLQTSGRGLERAEALLVHVANDPMAPAGPRMQAETYLATHPIPSESRDEPLSPSDPVCELAADWPPLAEHFRRTYRNPAAASDRWFWTQTNLIDTEAWITGVDTWYLVHRPEVYGGLADTPPGQRPYGRLAKRRASRALSQTIKDHLTFENADLDPAERGAYYDRYVPKLPRRVAAKQATQVDHAWTEVYDARRMRQDAEQIRQTMTLTQPPHLVHRNVPIGAPIDWEPPPLAPVMGYHPRTWEWGPLPQKEVDRLRPKVTEAEAARMLDRRTREGKRYHRETLLMRKLGLPIQDIHAILDREPGLPQVSPDEAQQLLGLVTKSMDEAAEYAVHRAVVRTTDALEVWPVGGVEYQGMKPWSRAEGLHYLTATSRVSILDDEYQGDEVKPQVVYRPPRPLGGGQPAGVKPTTTGGQSRADDRGRER
ncbi:MAG: hypothetical protein SF002_04855 [Alphaproteobacteria bacterium]|nr:hypothetical protein [Alphaproteobacteria bacterium]